MDAQGCCNECEAYGTEGGDEIHEAQGVEIGQLRQDQLSNAEVDDEFL